MAINEWAGCKADKCPYGKEYGNCDTCNYLIRKPIKKQYAQGYKDGFEDGKKAMTDKEIVEGL